MSATVTAEDKVVAAVAAIKEIDRLLTLAQHGRGGQAWGAISAAQARVRALLEELKAGV